jgi:hypothetical protein
MVMLETTFLKILFAIYCKLKLPNVKH